MEEVFTTQELQYLDKAKKSAKAFDDTTDFLSQAKSINSKNGHFWYDFCAAMRALPQSKSIDLRENGRICAAVYAANRAMEIAPHSPGVWAEKYLALEMLVHGLSANLNAMQTAGMELPERAIERFQEALKEIRKTLDGANNRFPNDAWFMQLKEDLIEDFGEYQG